jgi:CRP/FNR family transcriptional regulator, anaerobic regulatory protein
METNILSLIQTNGHKVEIPEGMTLFNDGDACSKMLFLTSGSIKVIKNSEEGKEFVLYRVTPDDPCVLSVSCIIGYEKYSAVGISENQLSGFIIDQNKFNDLLNSNSDFRSFVFKGFSHRLTQLILKIDEVVFKSLQERLRLFKESRNIQQMTHQEIAAELGTSREVITRLLKKIDEM